MGFPGGSVVKTLPAMQETQVCSLGQEDILEKEMATHSSILAGKSGQRSLARYSPYGRKKVRHNLATKQQQVLVTVVKKGKVRNRDGGAILSQ